MFIDRKRIIKRALCGTRSIFEDFFFLNNSYLDKVQRRNHVLQEYKAVRLV